MRCGYRLAWERQDAGPRPFRPSPITSRASADARVGCDFPFSLPRDLINARSWRGFALRYAADFADADTFRHLMRTQHSAIEHKRATDRHAGTPFNSYNLRLYRQTWWGIAGVVGPLVAARKAIVRPQQKLALGKPVLMEICPASSLKSISLYPSYKGRQPKHRKARQCILEALIDRGNLAAPDRRMRTLLVDNIGGDALDAVIGAIAAARADILAEPDAVERLEGKIYYEIG